MVNKTFIVPPILDSGLLYESIKVFKYFVLNLNSEILWLKQSKFVVNPFEVYCPIETSAFSILFSYKKNSVCIPGTIDPIASDARQIVREDLYHLMHLLPMFLFYKLWKRQKSSDILMFSWGMKMEPWEVTSLRKAHYMWASANNVFINMSSY